MMPTVSAAASMSERRWVEKKTVRPSTATSPTRTLRKARRATGSRPEVGSSRISSSGLLPSAKQSWSWAFWPLESFRILASAGRPKMPM
jgi:hypothetical protein